MKKYTFAKCTSRADRPRGPISATTNLLILCEMPLLQKHTKSTDFRKDIYCILQARGIDSDLDAMVEAINSDTDDSDSLPEIILSDSTRRSPREVHGRNVGTYHNSGATILSRMRYSSDYAVERSS